MKLSKRIFLLSLIYPVLASLGLAQTSYHDCSFCHVIHSAVGPSLTVASDQEVLCLTCHGPAGTSVLEAAVHTNRANGPYTFDTSCLDCHTPHSSLDNWLGGANLAQVGRIVDNVLIARIETPNSGVQDVVFESRGTTGGEPSLYSFADSDEDGNGIYDGVCEVCHTEAQHHTSSAPDAIHFTGQDCTTCHAHANGFTVPPHRSTTDCSICHLNPETQEQDLFTPHEYDCVLCHPAGVDGTILGPMGTWDETCEACHNPSIPETGSYPSPTKGHRCVVCHAESRSMDAGEHERHADKANCVVCHGSIPDVGTQIGSGTRDICYVCHSNPELGTTSTDFHEKHARKGLNCYECHAGQRPAVDVVSGPLVGSSAHVCDVCHDNKDPSEFQANMDGLHEEHTKHAIDCGACHISANLQDDRLPMPAIDDPVRAAVDRSGLGECLHCHSGGHRILPVDTGHGRHLDGQAQWCYNCHEGTDTRPQGLSGPVTQPSEVCILCHDTESYNDAYPFDVHEKHGGGGASLKCYACHQTYPRLVNWPEIWRAFQ